MTDIDATFYAQLTPVWSSDHAKRAGRPPSAAKVDRITQTKPNRPVGGSITVKLTVRVNPNLFMPLQPEAVIVVPDSLTLGTPIEVVAVDPNEEP